MDYENKPQSIIIAVRKKGLLCVPTKLDVPSEGIENGTIGLGHYHGKLLKITKTDNRVIFEHGLNEYGKINIIGSVYIDLDKESDKTSRKSAHRIRANEDISFLNVDSMEIVAGEKRAGKVSYKLPEGMNIGIGFIKESTSKQAFLIKPVTQDKSKAKTIKLNFNSNNKSKKPKNKTIYKRFKELIKLSETSPEAKNRVDEIHKTALENKGLVNEFVKEYSDRFPEITYKDFEQAGYFGLVYSAFNHDPSKGQFSTYAYFWIKRFMIQTIIDYTNMIRIPISLYNKISDMEEWIDNFYCKNQREPDNYDIATQFFEIEQWINEFTSEKGREPSIYEYDDKMDKVMKKVYYLKRVKSYLNVGSLNTVFNSGRGDQELDTELIEYVKSDEDVCIKATDKLAGEYVRKMLGELENSRQMDVLILRNGIGASRGMTLEEIAKVLKVTSRETVRQIENRALRKMRHPKISKKLKDIVFER